MHFPRALDPTLSKVVKAIGCDLSMVALAVLACLAGAIGNRRRILLKRSWTEPAIRLESLELISDKVGDLGSRLSDIDGRLHTMSRQGPLGYEELPGVATKEQVLGGRLPGQVFAIEILRRPVILERRRGRVQVTIDRRDITHGIYTNAGKRALCKAMLKGRLKKLADKLEKQIHDFFLAAPTGGDETLEVDLPLRWASGGVLSVVNWLGSYWTPLFFRDIPPIGWNISLGSSEAAGDDTELNAPIAFILREFLEETTILDREPLARRYRKGQKRQRIDARPIHANPVPGIQIPPIEAANDFAKHHFARRMYEDGLNIKLDPAAAVLTTFEPTSISVQVIDSRGVEHDPINDVLVTINPSELGIEIIKVANYSLEDDAYLLDGEIFAPKDAKSELVRMPVGMMSHGYLQEAFGDLLGGFKYSRRDLHTYDLSPKGRIRWSRQNVVEPSVRANRVPRFPDEVTHFDWDAQMRRRLASKRAQSQTGKQPTTSERARHHAWVRNFDRDFGKDGKRPVGTALFTPATAKALAYYFANKEREPSIPESRRQRPRRVPAQPSISRVDLFSAPSFVDFEELCYDTLVSLGYTNIIWRRGTAKHALVSDGGIDLECQYHSHDPDGELRVGIWLVQCKDWKTKTIDWRSLSDFFDEVRQRYRGDSRVGAIVMTSSFLSNAARDKAEREHQAEGYVIKVWDRKKLQTFPRVHPGKVQDIAGKLNRTVNIVRHMRAILASDRARRPIDQMLIRIQAGYSSLANVGSTDHRDSERRRYDAMLNEERELLLRLLEAGAQLRALICPPSRSGFVAYRHADRLNLLQDFLKDKDFASAFESGRIQMAVATEEGQNLMFFDQDILFEGHKTAVEVGYGTTLIYSTERWTALRAQIFDSFFDSCSAHTRREFGKKSDDRLSAPAALCAATLRVIEHSLKVEASSA